MLRAIGACNWRNEMRERGRSLGSWINHAQARHAARQTAHESADVHVEVAHDGEDRHQAMTPIPAPQRAAQTCADNRARPHRVEAAVTIGDARRRWQKLHRIEDDKRGDGACNTRDITRLQAIVSPERSAKADEPHQPKPRPGIQPGDAAMSEWWAGRSTHGRASMQPVPRGADRFG